MKNTIRTTAVFALMAIGAVAAQAQVINQEVGYAPEMAAAKSIVSRQQVQNAYLTARQNGSLPMTGDSYTVATQQTGTSGLTREQVRAEAIAANKAGTLMDGEGSIQ